MNKSGKNAGPSRRKPTARSRAYRQPNPSRQSNNQQFVTKKSLNGGKVQLPLNPPDVVYQPWVHVTLVDTFKGIKEYKVADMIAILRKQLDPTHRGFNQVTSGDGRFVIQMRMFEVHAWNMSGNIISLSAEDFLDTQSAKGGREQLCGFVDTGTNQHIPCLGYLFPSAHRSHVVRTDDQEGSIYLVNIQIGPNDSGLVYFRIAYRFDGPVTPPKLLLPQDVVIQYQVDQISGTSNMATSLGNGLKKVRTGIWKVSDTMAELNSLLKSQHSASTFTDVIHGIEKAVTLVSLVAADVDDFEMVRPDQGALTSSPR